MMLPTGSKTKPRKTNMSQLRIGQRSPQRRPSKPSTRPVIGKPQDATAWLTSGSNNWSAYTPNLPMPTTTSSRTQNSPQSGWPRVWLSWYQSSKTQGTQKLEAYHMRTKYVQGPDLHLYRKGLHISRKWQPAPQSAKRMPPRELWLQRPAPHQQSHPWGGEIQAP